MDGTTLGAYELTAEEAAGDVVIERPGEPTRRVVNLLDSDDDNPEWFDVLVVERCD
jgi:hypothetical protein